MLKRSARVLALVAIVSLSVVHLAPAQTDTTQAPKRFAMKGVVEIGGAASYQYSVPVTEGKTGAEVHTASAMPYLGYFVMDGLEVGLYPAGVVLRKEGGKKTMTELRFLAAPSYNFKAPGRVFPFIEGLAGFTASTDGDQTRNGFSWGGRAGVKIGVTGGGLVTVGVQYLTVTMNPSGAKARNGSNELSVSAGFSVWF